jgi:phenylpropionate dioxygenase-like ring-hydroxylating dioxygenase large terminal subunit
MSYANRLTKFARPEFLPEGWYWMLTSKEVGRGKSLPAKFAGKDFVIFRGEDDKIRILDAHCPHMGAHLCDGTVEGNSIRCPFHRWKFNEQGQCTDIPARADIRLVKPLNSYLSAEAYGLIWLWTGENEKVEPLPTIPELKAHAVDWSHGNTFIKNCHPNVVMINAIDAHHFQSVHHLIVDLEMESKVLTSRCIELDNRTPMPKSNLFLRFASRFYADALTYRMTYWWGHTGSVTIGPDFLHFHIIFALRPTEDGRTEGRTILVTPKRRFGVILNPILLWASKVVGNYFAKGDSVIFSRIKFYLQTPIKADRPILDFIDHYERQKPSSFGRSHSEDSRWTSNELPVI